MIQQGSVEECAGLLRAWHLAILRFALTRENSDRLGVLAIANTIDGLGGQEHLSRGFSFFRTTSVELSAAILRREQGDDAVVSRYLARIEDSQLRRTLAAALGEAQPMANLATKRVRPPQDLWRGLPSRAYPRR